MSLGEGHFVYGCVELKDGGVVRIHSEKVEEEKEAGSNRSILEFLPLLPSQLNYNQTFVGVLERV